MYTVAEKGQSTHWEIVLALEVLSQRGVLNT